MSEEKYFVESTVECRWGDGTVTKHCEVDVTSDGADHNELAENVCERVRKGLATRNGLKNIYVAKFRRIG